LVGGWIGQGVNASPGSFCHCWHGAEDGSSTSYSARCTRTVNLGGSWRAACTRLQRQRAAAMGPWRHAVTPSRGTVNCFHHSSFVKRGPGRAGTLTLTARSLIWAVRGRLFDPSRSVAIKDARWGRAPRQTAGLPASPTHVRLKPNPRRHSGLKRPARVMPAATHIPHWGPLEVSLFFSRSVRSPTVERGDAPAISRLPAGSAAFPRRR
jgi:hypothetical protein